VKEQNDQPERESHESAVHLRHASKKTLPPNSVNEIQRSTSLRKHDAISLN